MLLRTPLIPFYLLKHSFYALANAFTVLQQPSQNFDEDISTAREPDTETDLATYSDYSYNLLSDYDDNDTSCTFILQIF